MMNSIKARQAGGPVKRRGEEERECWEELECGSQGATDAGELVSLAELAGRICSAFPAEVTSLVDMSGGAGMAAAFGGLTSPVGAECILGIMI